MFKLTDFYRLMFSVMLLPMYSVAANSVWTKAKIDNEAIGETNKCDLAIKYLEISWKSDQLIE